MSEKDELVGKVGADVYMGVMRWIRVSDCESERGVVSCRVPFRASYAEGGVDIFLPFRAS